MSTTDIEAVREIYAALNRNDIPGVCKFFDPQIGRIEFEGSPSAGSFRGLEEVKAHFSRGRDNWAEGTCEPERLMAADNKVIVFVRVRVRLKNEVEWREGRTADVFTFWKGKVIEMRTFAEAKQALEWAGVEDVNPL